MKNIRIVGGGLAGSEAALYLADKGWNVELIEMRPLKSTPAHKTDLFAELVCSNSLKSKISTTSSGLLKEELSLLECKLLPIAKETSVPAGNALAVDRKQFSEKVTKMLKNHSKIEIKREEFCKLDDKLTIIATGPLTSDKLSKAVIDLVKQKNLYFFDAIAPIVATDSIDMNIAYKKSRRDDTNEDYINCPFSKEEYYTFVDALQNALKHEAHEFEDEFFDSINFNFYENCTPIEELARRGKDTLRFGVLRPVGLIDPKNNKPPFAVLQLRAETADLQAYNLVGCQTMMKYSEQKRVFNLIPGLENADFIRYGSIHRNTFLNSPKICNSDLSLKNKKNVFLAGQIIGVEGYAESIFSGLLTAKIINRENVDFPETTIVGQLKKHLITPKENYQPMNSNFGLLPEISMERKNKKLKKQLLHKRSIQDLKKYLEKIV